MPTVRIGDEIVRFEEGTPQSVIDRVVRERGGKAAAPLSRASVTPPATARDKEVSRRAAGLRVAKRMQTGGELFGQFGSGVLANFTDELSGGVSAATRGVYNAVRKGDIGEVGSEYRLARDAEREAANQYRKEHPIMSTAANVAGAVVSPGGKFKALAKAPAFIKAGAQGLVTGALSGAGAADEIEDVPGAAIQGGAFGGVLGAGTGAVSQLARKGVQALRSQSADEAANVAYSRVAKALDDTPRYPGSKLSQTPESATRDLRLARGRGNTDPAVMDLSPEMTNLAAYARRKPGSRVANELYDFGTNRATARAQGLDSAIRKGINPKTGTDAIGRASQLKNAHRQVATDYAGVVNDDVPLAWTKELDDLVHSKNPIVRRAFSAAKEKVEMDDLEPSKLGLIFDKEGILKKIDKPTMRTFDYLRRTMGRAEQSFKDAKDFDSARQVANKYHEVRNALAAANPEYGKMLSAQRSVFEMDRGLELGKKVLSRIGREPRKVAKEWDELDDLAKEDARTGFVDELLNMRNNRANPVTAFRAMMNKPDQRALLGKVFDNPANLNRFDKWLQREIRASKADSAVSGRQSITSDMMAMGEDARTPVQELTAGATRGYGFGGTVGATGNVVSTLTKFRNMMSDKAREELGRILMGDGSDLVAGVKKAQAAVLKRRAGDAAAARRVGKVVGYGMGTGLEQ